jgi:hypothetical protein
MKTAKISSVGILLTLAACTAQVAQREDLLSAAGFSFRPANTPAAAAALRALPPHKFVQQTRNGQPIWLYADPSVCGCLYVGDEAAYQRFRQMVFQKQLADEQSQAAMMNRDAAMEQNAIMMNWGVWGPWAPYYGGPWYR